MDEKTVKFLRDLNDRVRVIEENHAKNKGKKLSGMTLNKKTFDSLSKSLKDGNYCDMTQGVLPKGAEGMLWGVPLFIDDSCNDNELDFLYTTI